MKRLLHPVVVFALAMLVGLQALGAWAGLERVARGQCGYDFRATPNRCPECGARTRPH